MTAAELAQARRERLPTHCQTVRRFNQDGSTTVSDIEELTREQLIKTVANLCRRGWHPFGTYFVR